MQSDYILHNKHAKFLNSQQSSQTEFESCFLIAVFILVLTKKVFRDEQDT